MNSLWRDAELILAAIGLFVVVIPMLVRGIMCHCGKLRIWCWYTMRRALRTGTESMQREVAGGHAGVHGKIEPEGAVRLRDRCPKCGEELGPDGHHLPDPPPFI